MKFHKQLFIHDPANGKFGDCLRTCIACLLDIDDLESVPNFGIHYDDITAFTKAKDEYLKSQGLMEFEFPFNGDATLETLLEWIATWNPDTNYLLTGLSARGVNHVVIARNAKIIHDPHPSDSGLVGPCSEGDQPPIWWVGVLLPLAMHQEAA